MVKPKAKDSIVPALEVESHLSLIPPDVKSWRLMWGRSNGLQNFRALHCLPPPHPHPAPFRPDLSDTLQVNPNHCHNIFPTSKEEQLIYMIFGYF